MLVRRPIIIEAPSTLGLAAAGVEKLPERLLDLGLAKRIDAQGFARVPVLTNAGTIDPETRVLNASQIAAWSPHLADAVGDVLDGGGFPIVLGGDCTIVLGTMLFQPEAEPNGEGASMDLAFVTGYGPPLLTTLEGFSPIVRPEDVVAFGFRDHSDQKEFGSQPLPASLVAIDIHRVRGLGVRQAAKSAVEHLSRPELDGFFIHLDADVLDDELMPAVDFRVPGGLSADELLTTLKIALGSDKAVGLEVAIYNPAKDADGSAGRLLTNVLADGFG
jgi:arginase